MLRFCVVPLWLGLTCGLTYKRPDLKERFPERVPREVSIGKPFINKFYFFGKLMEQIRQKLHRLILLRFGLITFWFHYGRAQKPSFSWFRDFRTYPWLPEPTIVIFGDTRTLQMTQENPNRFRQFIILGNPQTVQMTYFENFGKTDTDQSWRSVLKLLEHLVEYEINIFQKHEIGNFENLNKGSISVKKHKNETW